MSDAQLTAVTDQADAAGADAEAMLAGIAGRRADAGEFVKAVEGVYPYHARLFDLMRSALRAAGEAGQPLTCDHVDLAKPEVSHWATIAAEQLRCASCTNQVTQHRQGLEICALCGNADRSGLFAGGFRSPAVVLPQGEDAPPVALAALIHWVLCSGCLVAE